MSFCIKINPATSHFADLEIAVDGQSVGYSLKQDLIVLHTPNQLHDGLHQLTVSLGKKNGTLDIADVFVGGCSSRQNIYFSYISKGTDILQPATTLWEPDTTWVYPFASPFSHWHNILLSKSLFAHKFGQDLYEEFDIFWPQSMDPGEQYPMLVRDFFRRDFDFTAIPKTDLSRYHRPYQKLLGLHVPDSVEKELLSKIDVLRQLGELPTQTTYNKRESRDWDPNTAWKVAWFVKDHTPNQIMYEHFPATIQWIIQLDLNAPSVWVGVLDPDQFVAPHCDPQPPERQQYHGCTLIYLPIGWTPGVWFKFASVGMVPDQPCVINNQHYPHALVNNSSRTRLSIGIRSTLQDINGRWHTTLTD